MFDPSLKKKQHTTLTRHWHESKEIKGHQKKRYILTPAPNTILTSFLLSSSFICPFALLFKAWHTPHVSYSHPAPQRTSLFSIFSPNDIPSVSCMYILLSVPFPNIGNHLISRWQYVGAPRSQSDHCQYVYVCLYVLVYWLTQTEQHLIKSVKTVPSFWNVWKHATGVSVPREPGNELWKRKRHNSFQTSNNETKHAQIPTLALITVHMTATGGQYKPSGIQKPPLALLKLIPCEGWSGGCLCKACQSFHSWNKVCCLLWVTESVSKVINSGVIIVQNENDADLNVYEALTQTRIIKSCLAANILNSHQNPSKYNSSYICRYIRLIFIHLIMCYGFNNE